MVNLGAGCLGPEEQTSKHSCSCWGKGRGSSRRLCLLPMWLLGQHGPPRPGKAAEMSEQTPGARSSWWICHISIRLQAQGENHEERSWGCPTGNTSLMETHHCHQPEKTCVEFFPCQLDLDKHHLPFAFTPLINRDRGLRSKPTSGGISPSLILTTAAAWDTHIPILRDLFAHIDCTRCELFWSMPVQITFPPHQPPLGTRC